MTTTYNPTVPLFNRHILSTLRAIYSIDHTNSFNPTIIRKMTNSTYVVTHKTFKSLYALDLIDSFETTPSGRISRYKLTPKGVDVCERLEYLVPLLDYPKTLDVRV